jgi:glucose dehydrogenase
MSNQQNDVCHDRMPAEPTRRQVLIAGASLITAPLVRGLTAAAKQAQTTGAGAQALGRASEWVSYGADKASSKYSSLAQIGPQNFSRLRVAWTWRSAEEEVDRQGVTENDVIDFTPELRKEALAVLAKYNYGPLYTPPSLEKPTIQMPGYAGGASWAGAACDGETGIMCIPPITNPLAVTMMKSGSQSPAPYVASPGPMETLQGVPLWKPPYGRITAIDLNTGEHRWMVPMGDLDHPRLKPLGLAPVGRPTRGHALLTKTLLIVGQRGPLSAQKAAPRFPPSESMTRPCARTTRARGRLSGRWRCRVTQRPRR